MALAATVWEWTWPGASEGADLAVVKSAIEAVQVLVAVLVAFLLYGRQRRTGALNDGLLVLALLLLGANSVAVIVTLAAEPGAAVVNGVTWARVLLRLVACCLMVVAALGRERAWPGRAGPALVAIAAVVVGASVALVASGSNLPAAIRGDDPTPVLRALLVLVVLLLAAATVGFARRARQWEDPMTASFAVGTALAVCSWANFVGRPSVYTDEVHVGDVLRLGFWLVLLVGAAREVADSWAGLARAAVVEERRRLARDLHDGLAQELAFIAQHTRLLQEGDAPAGTTGQLASAAQRALDESRRAIATLRDVEREPLATVLAVAAEDTASRVGTAVEVVVDPAVTVAPATGEALVRIVREAVANAGRHGGASRVSVRLGADRALRITDDGSGFHPGEVDLDGRYGLVTMRERAEGIGATFHIGPADGGGTVVEVVLP